MVLFCLCGPAAAQWPQLNEQHLVVADIPLQFLGAVGQALTRLQAMKPDDFVGVREKAAAGDASAEALLCLAYRTGRFVQQDATGAHTWCGKGADQGNKVAVEELGLLFLNGPGETDSAEAIKWLTKAADLGSASAMDSLGTIYANGLGVPQDFAQALRWYRESVVAGSPVGDYDLGVAYLLGQGVPVDSRDAIDSLTKAANAGFSYSMMVLGLIYETGFASTKPDLKTALAWFQKGAELGEVHCQVTLGSKYANGVGVDVDYAEAVKWYRAAAEQHDPVGEYGLAVRYENGQGVTRDLSEAMIWFGKAADAGHADAAFNLALILADQVPGRDVPPDYASAVKYLAIAASQDISDGQCVLGLLYAHGYGVPQDDVAAYEWVLLSQRGTHNCDQDRVNLEARMTAAQVTEAKRRAAAFKPLPSKFNYGSSVPR